MNQCIRPKDNGGVASHFWINWCDGELCQCGQMNIRSDRAEWIRQPKRGGNER
jgi:hypothetical protein